MVSVGYKALLCCAASHKGPRFRDRHFIDSGSCPRGLFDHQGTSTKLFARAATCDVTPRDRQTRLAGFASRTAPVSTILDPIEISALLLESAERRCLIFSFDLMIVGSELQDLILAKL